jgi:hypothetical protein
VEVAVAERIVMVAEAVKAVAAAMGAAAVAEGCSTRAVEEEACITTAVERATGMGADIGVAASGYLTMGFMMMTNHVAGGGMAAGIAAIDLTQ